MSEHEEMREQVMIEQLLNITTEAESLFERELTAKLRYLADKYILEKDHDDFMEEALESLSDEELLS